MALILSGRCKVEVFGRVERWVVAWERPFWRESSQYWMSDLCFGRCGVFLLMVLCGFGADVGAENCIVIC